MNPYEPPAAPYAPPQYVPSPYGYAPAPYRYRPLGALTGTAVAVIVAQVTVQLISAALISMMGGVEDLKSGADPGILVAVAVLGLTQLALSLASWIAYLVWVYRAQSNVWALGRSIVSITPGWAVGWYFIPIASMFMPYRAMKETWEGSGGGTGSPLVLAWWLTWIFSSVTAIALSLAKVPDANLVAAVLRIVPCVLVVLVLLGVAKRQRAAEVTFQAPVYGMGDHAT